jgi:hypothetical protein
MGGGRVGGAGWVGGNPARRVKRRSLRRPRGPSARIDAGTRWPRASVLPERGEQRGSRRRGVRPGRGRRSFGPMRVGTRKAQTAANLTGYKNPRLHSSCCRSLGCWGSRWGISRRSLIVGASEESRSTRRANENQSSLMSCPRAGSATTLRERARPELSQPRRARENTCCLWLLRSLGAFHFARTSYCGGRADHDGREGARSRGRSPRRGCPLSGYQPPPRGR